MTVRGLLDSNEVSAPLSGAIHLTMHLVIQKTALWATREQPPMQNSLIAPQNVLTIAEMAALAGVSYRTLRFYEDRGLLQPDRIGHKRLYSQTDRIRLELIMKGKRLGFSLGEIEHLIGMPNAASSDVISSLTKNELTRQIDQLAERREGVQIAIGELTTALAAKGVSARD